MRTHPAPRDTELARVAYHEAGHAVAAMHVGQAVASLTIATEHAWRGACSLYRDMLLSTPAHPQYADAVRRAVAVTLAGPLAEYAYLGCVPMQPPKRCRADYLAAMDLTAKLKDTELREAVIPAAERRVRAMLKQPRTWAAVERLAGALASARSLGSTQIRELMAA